MLNITTSYAVPNISRMRAMSAQLATEITGSGASAVETNVVVCEVQFRPPAATNTEDVQRARAYNVHVITLRIRNGQCDTVLFNADATVNPYSSALVRGVLSVPTGYDQIVAEIQTGSANGMLNRVETKLASMGCVPAGT